MQVVSPQECRYTCIQTHFIAYEPVSVTLAEQMYCEPYLVYLIEERVCRIMVTVCVNVCFSEISFRRKMYSVTSSEAIVSLTLKHNVMAQP